MAEPDELILDTIKATLGLPKDYSPFDAELIVHINSVVSVLRQLGVGPDEGILVTKDTTWSQLLVDNDEKQLEDVKTLIFLRVKMIFDSSSMAAHHISAFQKIIEELEWRITVAANPAEENMIPVIVVEVE